MKKAHLTMLTLLLFGCINAQKVRFGIKGGLNISTVTVRNENVNGQLSSKFGFHAGVYLACRLSEKMEFHPEILYSNQGYHFKGTDLNAKINEKANINYIALPLMFCYYPIKDFSFEFGPQVSFLLSNKSKIDYTIVPIDEGSIIEGSTTVDNKDVTQSIELGLNVGLGFKITKNVIVSGRYNFGLTMINKQVVGSQSTDVEVRNSVFQFSVGYLFD